MSEKVLSDPILRVRDLQTHFKTDAGVVKAVDGVSFDLHKGETLVARLVALDAHA